MPQVITGVVARPPLGGAFLAYVKKVTQALSRSLELTRPDEIERVTHWMLLGLAIFGAAFVRFWGLGSVGLHGDEETMAMAVRGIVEHGAPLLPSGMFYPRGLTQLALMALSVSIFGETEWALRLPSALCGIALVPIGYFAGRRFLRPNWAIALAALLAFLPELIVYSQTARMYIFLVTFIAIAMVCVFAWERTSRPGWLIGAIVALTFGLEMHSLAIACVLILLLPGALQNDTGKLGTGLLAMFAVAISFVTIELFVGAQYPDPPSDLFGSASAAAGGPSVSPEFPMVLQIALFAGGLATAFAVLFVAYRSSRRASVLTGLLLIAGLALQLVLYYHVAALLYIGGLVIAARAGLFAKPKALLIFFAAATVIAIVHAVLLAPTAGTLIRLVGALNGQPSAWPYVRVSEYSALAAVLCAGAIGWGLYRIARGLAAPDYSLLALLGAWAPLFALGMFAWDVPSRYTATSLLPLLISTMAFAQMLTQKAIERMRVSRRAPIDAACAALLALFAVNPSAAAATINAGYKIYPDHKGAAQFIRSQGVTDDDVILAEDVLQQTYYLGGVDYWLIGPDVARRFVRKAGEEIVDFYTGTPVVVTTAMLDEVLAQNRGKRIFIVGSGEGWEHGYRDVRGELHAAIESERFETKFVGRDGVTRVLQAVSRATQSMPQKTEKQSRAELTESAEAALEQAAPKDKALPVTE